MLLDTSSINSTSSSSSGSGSSSSSETPTVPGILLGELMLCGTGDLSAEALVGNEGVVQTVGKCGVV